MYGALHKESVRTSKGAVVRNMGVLYKGEKTADGRKKDNFFDYNLMAVIVLLLGFGLVMVYSTSAYAAEIRQGNDMYYFTRQALIAVGSLLAIILISHFDYHILWFLAGAGYVLSLLLILLVKTPFGVELNGASRWVNLFGLQFQPAEFAKIAVIVFIPTLIIRMGKNAFTVRGLLFLLLAGAIPAAETFVLTSNLSTAIIIMMITFVIIFVASPKTWPYILLAILVIIAVTAFLIYVKRSIETGSDFRIRRILVWLEPELYPRDGGFQIMQGLYALGSGGLFGKGLGNSSQKRILPEAQNDMIFSIVCEELGVFGGIMILLLFGYLIYRLYYTARHARDLFGCLMVTGVFGHIILQVILNICVVLNVIPTTGITLPFISYGGTSIVFLMLEMGIALMVFRQIPVRRLEKDLWGDVVRQVDY